MANRKLTELPTLSPINFDSDDILYIVDVQTDVSKKITYASLVGDNITALSAYDALNTLDINFLSGSIDANDADILALEASSVGATTKITAISAAVDTNITDIVTVSAIAEAATDNAAAAVNGIRTDVDIVSTTQLGLSSEADELADDVEGIATVLASASALGIDNATVLNTASAVTDAFTMTRVATSDLSATHTFQVSLNGGNYKILLHQA